MLSVSHEALEAMQQHARHTPARNRDRPPLRGAALPAFFPGPDEPGVAAGAAPRPSVGTGLVLPKLRAAEGQAEEPSGPNGPAGVGVLGAKPPCLRGRGGVWAALAGSRGRPQGPGCTGVGGREEGVAGACWGASPGALKPTVTRVGDGQMETLPPCWAGSGCSRGLPLCASAAALPRQIK